MLNRQVVLASRPDGAPVEANFRVEENPIPPLTDGQFRLENLYVSLDAGFRNWMDEGSGDDVLPAMALGAPVQGLTLGRVAESNNQNVAPGTLWMVRSAWEEHSILDGSDFLTEVPDVAGVPLHYYLGILGDTGLSAYFGLVDHGKPQPGETVMVSAAAGAVGSVAGQIAKLMGATTVGIASGADKCARLTADLGYDVAIDRTANDVDAALAAACPNGVDVYFDNVAGPLLETVLNHIADGARILCCGAVASYNEPEPVPGPANLFSLVTHQARMIGFMTHFQVDRYPAARTQMAEWLADGKLKSIEYMQDGIDRVGPAAFCDLFRGANFGKTIVRLDAARD